MQNSINKGYMFIFLCLIDQVINVLTKVICLFFNDDFITLRNSSPTPRSWPLGFPHVPWAFEQLKLPQ